MRVVSNVFAALHFFEYQCLTKNANLPDDSVDEEEPSESYKQAMRRANRRERRRKRQHPEMQEKRRRRRTKVGGRRRSTAMTGAEVKKAKEQHIESLEMHNSSKAQMAMMDWDEFKAVEEYASGIDWDPFWRSSD